MKYEVQIGNAQRTVEVESTGANAFRARVAGLAVDGKSAGASIADAGIAGGAGIAADAVSTGAETFSILLDGRAFEARVSSEGRDDNDLLVRCAGMDFRVQVRDPRSWRARRHNTLEASGPQRVLAPMPGKVVRVLVAVGDQVEAGHGLLVVEAMKMQNEIRAPKGGRIERIFVVEGQAVRTQEALLVIA